jgi:LCCL domain
MKRASDRAVRTRVTRSQQLPRRHGTRGLAVVAVAGFVVAGCGSDPVSVSSTPTSPAATSTTTALAPGSTTTSESSATTSSTSLKAASTTTGSTASSAPPSENAWAVTATAHRGKNGERFTIDCTSSGSVRSVWGTETYTDDSSICTAAVHVGLITVVTGGKVEYEIAPGLDEYSGTLANGITTSHYLSFQGSFTFPAAPPGSGRFTVGPESWARAATIYRGQNGNSVPIECSPNGTRGGVWGTGTYTDDSSICTAAVHAGIITMETGGKVVIEIAPGQSSYQGSTANGIESTDYGQFAGSFTFAKGGSTG